MGPRLSMLRLYIFFSVNWAKEQKLEAIHRIKTWQERDERRDVVMDSKEKRRRARRCVLRKNGANLRTVFCCLWWFWNVTWQELKDELHAVAGVVKSSGSEPLAPMVMQRMIRPNGTFWEEVDPCLLVYPYVVSDWVENKLATFKIGETNSKCHTTRDKTCDLLFSLEPAGRLWQEGLLGWCRVGAQLKLKMYRCLWRAPFGVMQIQWQLLWN
jgi:hypothetical protein